MSTPPDVPAPEPDPPPFAPPGDAAPLGDAAPVPLTASAPPRLAPQGAGRPLLAALITTVVVTVVSYVTPDRYAATAVGVSFLAATWWLVLRRDEATIREHGLALGGLLEPSPLDLRRIVRETASALGWAALLSALIFPAFWLGYLVWWHPTTHFAFRLPSSIFDELAGQLVVIALPEEAFFRGFLQTSLDRAWPPRHRILGADLGPGLLVSAAIFAVGHLLTIRHPARLAVFFPALVFGWLRARTRGVGASVLFHAACNILSAALMRGYGLA